jgi:psp operon transcriptional activator
VSFEQKPLVGALAANRFNRRRTAAALGLTYDQLRHYLKRHALGARR